MLCRSRCKQLEEHRMDSSNSFVGIQHLQAFQNLNKIKQQYVIYLFIFQVIKINQNQLPTQSSNTINNVSDLPTCEFFPLQQAEF